MATQGICILIDIRQADTGEGKKSGTSSHPRQMKYVVLDERRVIRLDKLYGSATPQNSIDFLKHIMAQVTIPINSILLINSYTLRIRLQLKWQLSAYIFCILLWQNCKKT